ncbi:uncharacterized protein LOC117644591 [Thrips palmi]|uniref:Uncharacterized protein LOC117644591 n=1 Tax=Thrips palmi TaxID=161013 RepID=A0A6P8ZM64_THRPL|nr:uncharacterized protein LOC117644591 [Thrips palmi]
MDWTGSVGCQNCVALNKKLELFDLLKQKCCKTDDITKNFLLLKTSYEKSAKLLENKSKKLSEARSKLKDAAKAEEISKRKAAEFQLRLVSSDIKCQDLLKELDAERKKNATLLQEKCHFENLVERKENEITSLNIKSKQCEEKFSNDLNSINAKMEKKISRLKAEVLKQQELNSKLKGPGNHKKKYDKLREDIVDIFKDGLILAGEPLKRFKKLFNRLQENETAAKLEAMLDTPSMTPDGTTSSDTGVFSGDEDFGCPSLENDLEMSSDNDEDFENMELQSDTPTHSKMLMANTSPSEDRFPTMELDADLIQNTSGSNVSNDSVNDGDSTLCPISTDSITDHSDMDLKLPFTSASGSCNHLDAQEPVVTSNNFKSSANAEGLPNIAGCDLNINNHASVMSPLSSPSEFSPKSTPVKPPPTTIEPIANTSHAGITDSLFSPPGGDVSASFQGQRKNDTYELSFDVSSSTPSDNCPNSNEVAPSKSDQNSSVASETLTGKSDCKLLDISVPKSPVELTNSANSLCSLEASEELEIPLGVEKEESAGNSKDFCHRSDVSDAVSDGKSPVEKSTSSSISLVHDGLSKVLQDYKKGYASFVKGESFIPSKDGRSTKKKKPSDNCLESEISAAISKLSAFKYQPPSDNPSCSANIHHDLSDNSIKDTKSQEDELDLDSMLHEWNPPTPILPFSDDSCGFESILSNNLLENSPIKCLVTTSVGTNTDITHLRSTASSPISHLFVQDSSLSPDKGFKHERILKNAYSSPPKLSSCDRASSPMKIRCKNIGVMPIAEFTRNVAVSPVRTTKSSIATSPSRSLFRDVSVSPMQVKKLDCATNTSNSGISVSNDFENEEESWSREAKMLQQTLEVLGLSTGASSSGVLDQSLVDELRKALEMALNKTSKTDVIPRRKPVHSKQFDTSYCSFNPCEFAEICNQQHYNLHLLAKGKNVEKTMCSREKKRRRKLKRLNHSSRRHKSLSTPSFKEEILEEDDSSQKTKKKQLTDLFEDSISMKELSENNSSNVDITDSDESFNVRPAISSECSIKKSMPHPEGVVRGKRVEQMNVIESHISAKNPMTRKSFVPEAIHAKNNDRPKVGDGCNSSEDKNARASCTLKDALSDAPDEDFNPIDETSSEFEKRPLGSATPNGTNVVSQSEPNLDESDSSDDTLIIDESIPSTTTVLPEVSECNASTEVPSVQLVHEGESLVPDTDHFVLPKPLRMSLRKRRQSSSSESSTAENSPGVNDSSVVLRRSPRMKKIRMAHDGQSEVLQGYQKGYSYSMRAETSVSSEGGRSTGKNKPIDNSPNLKISDSLSKLSAFKFQSPAAKNLDEQAKSNSVSPVPESVQRVKSNTRLSDKSLKRSAENESIEEESSKRLKHPSIARPSVENRLAIVQKVSNSSAVAENGLEDSDTDMECDEEPHAGTKNTKATTTNKSSIARKPSKLQKLRSTVSKAHPMVQGTKNTRSPAVAKEHIQESVQSTEHPHGSKSESTKNPKLVEGFEDEASIIERIRGRGNIRMAAAASGRTAQLIQVKPGAKRHQRPPLPNASADYMPTKPLPRVARTQPLVRPADRVSALGRSTPSHATERSMDRIPSTSTDSTSESPGLRKEDCQGLAVLNAPKLKLEQSLKDTEVSVHLKTETYESCFISDIDLRISTYSPLVYALSEQENSRPETSNKKELIHTQVLVATTLKDFIAAPSFTSTVLQKAVDALSAPNLYNIMPVIVQSIVKMMDDDFDTAPLRLGNQQSYVPPLTPVQQQLVTLIVQLSSQHQHLQQLPHQLLRLLEYRVFRLGVTPEGDRLVWCSKLHAAICRIHRLRTQALIFCWDSLYTLRGRSYYVVKAVMDVWPYLFPVNPSFEKACPNAQVLLHLLRSFVEDKNGAQQSHFDNSWLKRLLRSSAMQSLSINSSTLASTIFSNLISGAADTNVAALVLLAKREEENWTMRDIVSMRLLPALDKWCKKSLNDLAGERVIWILSSILRAIPPERNGNTSDNLMKLLISELLKPDTTLTPQMQEVVALGLVLLSRHNVENVAIALASWNPKYGPSRGFSSRLLQYLTSVLNSGVRPVPWWQNVAVKYSKSQLAD